MNATTPFQVWKCLIMDEMLGNFVHRTSQCILVVQPNFRHESSAELNQNRNESFHRCYMLSWSASE